jgi:hypothetical protein
MPKQKQLKIKIFANVFKNKKQKYLIYITICYETQNWAQVHPVSIGHPWDVSTTWLESTCGKFNFLDDLERHTPVYIRSHSWQCMSEQKPSHEVEGIVRRAPRRDCVICRDPQIQVCQACSVIPKKIWVCNCCQSCFNKVLSKGFEYLFKCVISLFFITPPLPPQKRNVFALSLWDIVCRLMRGKKRGGLHFIYSVQNIRNTFSFHDRLTRWMLWSLLDDTC